MNPAEPPIFGTSSGLVARAKGLPIFNSERGSLRLSGRNAPINERRQVLHENGTPGKSQWVPSVDSRELTQRAWAMGKPVFRNNIMIGKKFAFDRAVGMVNGKPTATVQVRFSRRRGIHGFPSS